MTLTVDQLKIAAEEADILVQALLALLA